MSYHVVSCVMSCHIISYHIIPYHCGEALLSPLTSSKSSKKRQGIQSYISVLANPASHSRCYESIYWSGGRFSWLRWSQFWSGPPSKFHKHLRTGYDQSLPYPYLFTFQSLSIQSCNTSTAFLKHLHSLDGWHLFKLYVKIQFIQNVICFHYKDQSLNVVWGNYRCLLRQSNERTYTLCGTTQIFLYYCR